MLAIYVYLRKFVYTYKKKCIYFLAFTMGVLGCFPSTLYRRLGTPSPDFRTVIAQLVQAQPSPPYGLYNTLYKPDLARNYQDFITIHAHSNQYINEVLAFLKEKRHPVVAYCILQDMMQLLSAPNYALFLEACAEAYLANKMSTRMLIEMTYPIRWSIQTNDMLWRPFDLLHNYNNASVQKTLDRIKQNIYLPIYFKKCIADIASGKAYIQLAGSAGINATTCNF